MLKANDIEAKVRAADAALIAQCENVIDKKLEAEWAPNGEVAVSLSTQFPARVAGELADMYRQGGWDVSVQEGTQHDPGTTLRFKKHVPSPSTHYER